MVFSVVVNCPCSVTNTKCKPNIVCHLFVKDFGHHRFTMLKVLSLTKGHFTHGTESSWPVAHFKHSHWWKRWRWSKFVAHYTWGTNRVRECKMDVNYMDSYMASNGSCFVVTWTLFFKTPPLEGRLDTKLGDHGTLNARNYWFIWFYHVWGPAWIEINWNHIWLRVRSHMTSHYTRGFVTTLHDFGGALRWPLDTFFWAPTTSWSRLLACAWSGPKWVSFQRSILRDNITSQNIRTQNIPNFVPKIGIWMN